MKSLPTVFSDALSYNQQVCLLTKAINDMANTINGLPDYIIELVKELLDQLGLEEIVKEVLADLYFLNVKNPPNNMTAAVGDGVTDDTAAIQAMIAYLGGKRAYLFFPAGIYSVTGLNVTTNMSLVGLDRYQTTLQLRAGSNKDLLIGELGACTINDITLDANMPGQTQNCSVFDGNVGNMLISNVIFKNGYNVLSIDVDGLVQMNNIVFDGVQGNGFSVGGDRVIINDIQFVNNSTLNAGTLITVSSNNSMITGLLNTGSCETGLNVSGNNNVIIGVIRSATTPIVNAGTDNYIDIIGSVHTVIDGAYTHTMTGDYTSNMNSKHETVRGDKTEIVNGDNLETISGTNTISSGVKTETITGNSTETVSGNKSISSEQEINLTGHDITISPETNLKYPKDETVVSRYFKGLPITDNQGDNYLLLPGNENIENDISAVKEAPYFTYFFTPYCQTVEYYPQGCCLIDDNTLVCAYTDPTGDTNTATLQKIDLTTGTILVSNTVTNAYHCNSLSYIPETDEIYSVRYNENGTTGESNQIIVFNPDTLTISRTITVSGVDSIACASYQNGKLYISDHAAYASMYSCNLDGTNVQKLFTTQFNTMWLSYVDKNLQAWMTNGFNGLVCYDLQGNLIGTYRLDLFSSDRASCLIEIEAFMEKSDGTLLFADVGYVRREAGYFRRHVLNSFNKSIAKNIPLNWLWRNVSADTSITCNDSYHVYQCGNGTDWAYDSIDYAIRMTQQLDGALVSINGLGEVFDQWVVVRSKNLIFFNNMTIKGMVVDYSKVSTAQGLTITSDCATQVAAYCGISRPTCLALWRFSEFIANTSTIDGKNVAGVNGVYQGYLSNAKLTSGRIVNCSNNVWGQWSTASWFGANTVDFTADTTSPSIRTQQYGANIKERFGNMYGFLQLTLRGTTFANFTTQTFNAKSFKGNMLSMTINNETFVYDLYSSKTCSATLAVGGSIVNVKFVVSITDNSEGAKFNISSVVATPSSVALSSININKILLW
jgi:hypothetical protein